MKKLLAFTAMAVLLCLAGLVMSGTAFADRCVDNEDGTVTDNGTGLMWQKASAGPMNWDAAMSYASGLSLAGHSGWRLPTKDELVGLYNSPCKGMMDVVRTWYWSSSPVASNSDNAWNVSFFNGNVNYGYVGYYGVNHSSRVRAVCAGQ